MKNIYWYLIFILFSTEAGAAVVLDTAAGNPVGGGLVVSDEFYQFHRFELVEKTTLSNVGAFFNASQNYNVFAAIISLSSSNDYPDSTNLITADLLFNTLLNIGGSSGLKSVNIDVTLDSGWYALGFGGGLFGASDLGFAGASLAVMETDTALSQIVFTAKQSTATYIGQTSTARFYITSVPLPPSAGLFIFSTVLLGFVRNKSRT